MAESIYRYVTSMEPLLPTKGKQKLAELSVEIFQKSGELKAGLPSPVVRQELAKLVAEMNSYYSNLIEGHKTLPRDVERALKNQLSETDAKQRRNQQLAVAHIKAESAMRQRLRDDAGVDVYAPEFIQWLHGEFYSHLPEEEWTTESESGVRHALVPGEFRSYQVDVNRHTPPDHACLGAFMERFQAVYSSDRILATNRLVALAAAHHRLAWIHPFGDGNGRVARLQSQAAAIRSGLDGEGLWTLSRGLARAQKAYYTHLQNADRARDSDIDGRGNLSDDGLSKFCIFFLERMLDQITFMIGLIDPFKLQERIEGYFRFTRVDLESRQREYLTKLLKALVLQGDIPRGAIPDILGLKGTASREVVRKALDEGLATATERGPLRIAFTSKVVDYYFPLLFTDLPVEHPA